MEERSCPELDKTGKAVFDEIYNARDPRSYYQAMRHLGYQIPQQAKPHFARLFEGYRAVHPVRHALHVLDIGASYGVNAALLKWNVPLHHLYEHYEEAIRDDVSRECLLDRDQNLLADLNAPGRLQITGLDVATNALDYALETGFIDHGLALDLENGDTGTEQAELIATIDCVISTGCIGYVTDTSLRRILRICTPRRPWMTHCILRMFPVDPYVELLQSHGYAVWLDDELLPQRRFASDEEQGEVVRNLERLRVDPTGYEADGCLFARVLYAVPHEHVSAFASACLVP